MVNGRTELSLNGEWEIVFDEGQVGRREGWHSSFPAGQAVSIKVPSVWNEIRPNYIGVAWYRRRFEGDPEWEGGTVRLKFWAVSHAAEVWLNGKSLGGHEGGYTPFEFDITGSVRLDGMNEVVVRAVIPFLTDTANFLQVWQPISTEAVDGLRLEEVPNAKQFCYGNFGGLWQPVQVLVTPRVWIEDVFVKPSVREEKVTVEVTVRNDSAAATEEVSLRVSEFAEPEEELAEKTGTDVDVEYQPDEPAVVAEAARRIEAGVGSTTLSVEMSMETFLCWSPETPVLYTLEVALESGDRVRVDFGMREFTIRGNAFCLNDEKIVLRAALFQPSYPVTLAYPFDEKLAEEEIRLAKAAGLNALRMHIKTPPPVTLKYADRLGVLIQEEPPIGWLKNSPNMKERALREVREMVRRDRNHPSVVMWGMLNETGNFFETKDGAQTIKRELCLEARRHDPTRVVTDDSGGMEWTKDPARYLLPGSTEFVEYYDYHLYKPGPVNDEIFSYFSTAGREGQLNYISEFGFGGMEDLPGVIEEYDRRGPVPYEDKMELTARLERFEKAFRAQRLDEVFGSFSKFCSQAQEVQALTDRFQIEAMRVNPKIGGYCLTQFQDGSFEYGAGIVDRFRRPKTVLTTLRHANSDLQVVLWSPRRNVHRGERVPLRVWLVNDAVAEAEVVVHLVIRDEDDRPVLREVATINLAPGVQQVFDLAPALDVDPGHYTIAADVEHQRESVRKNSIRLSVFERVDLAGAREVEVVEPNAFDRDRLKTLGFPWRAWQRGARHEKVLIPPLADSLEKYPRETVAEIVEEISLGGEVILLELPPGKEPIRLGGVEVRVEPSAGCFLGCLHYSRGGAAFEGLPSSALMSDFYRNIFPVASVFGTDSIAEAGTIDTDKVRVGADLVSVPAGRGTITFCQLRVWRPVVPDAAADIVLRNLLRRSGHEHPGWKESMISRAK